VGVVALVSTGVAACSSNPREGYSFQSTYASDVRSVAVPVFENYTFEIGVEAELTEAVIKEIQRSTGLKVVQGGGADSMLTGVVTRSEMRRLTLDRQTGLVQEQALTFIIDFDWKDNRSGSMIASRRNFAASEVFVPARPSQERIDTGRTGAVQRLARDIAHEMRAQW